MEGNSVGAQTRTHRASHVEMSSRALPRTRPGRSSHPPKHLVAREFEVVVRCARSRFAVGRIGRACGECSGRSEEHTYELQVLMRIAYAGFCLNRKKERSYRAKRA